MKLTFGGSTTNGNHCPTLYRTDRGTIVVQGSTVTDPEALAQMERHGNGVPTDESAVEIPAELMPFVNVAELEQVALDPERPEFVVDADAAARIPGYWR